jgi:predicted ABC-type ATPase
MLEGKVPQPDGQRIVTILGGGPASGKSSLRKKAEAEMPENSSVGIDPDEMKAALPGYEDLAVKSTKAAGIYHEESSALAKSLYSAVLDSGLNAVYDGTGDGSVKSLKKKIDQARAAGCKVVGSYMTLDIEEALKRNRSRYEHAKAKYDAGESNIPPRLVADDEVRKIHGNVTDTSIACAKFFDDFKLYDNSGPKGSEPELIAVGGNGKPITAVNREKLQAYIDKSPNRNKYFINDNGEVEVRE